VGPDQAVTLGPVRVDTARQDNLLYQLLTPAPELVEAE